MKMGLYDKVWERMAGTAKAKDEIQKALDQGDIFKARWDFMKEKRAEIAKALPPDNPENAPFAALANTAVQTLARADKDSAAYAIAQKTYEAALNHHMPSGDELIAWNREIKQAQTEREREWDRYAESIRKGSEGTPGREPTTADQERFMQLYNRYGRSGAGGDANLTGNRRINAQAKDFRDRLAKEHPEYSVERLDSEEAKYRSKLTAEGGSITPNERQKLEGHYDQFNESLRTIDKVLNVLQTYPGAAGLAGKAMRLEERLSDILGGNETERVQMMREIEFLRAAAPMLLLDRTGRPLSAEAAHVNDIVAGLSTGDTGPNTIRAMQELRDRYRRMQENLGKRLEGTWEPKPGGTPAPAAPANFWERDKPVE
jgi:hypothetical protein